MTLVLNIILTSTLVNNHTDNLNPTITLKHHILLRSQFVLQLRSRLFVRYCYYYTSTQVINRQFTSCIPMCLNVSDDRNLNITITVTLRLLVQLQLVLLLVLWSLRLVLLMYTHIRLSL